MSILKNLVGISVVSIDEILANPGPKGIVVFDNRGGKYLKLDTHLNVEKEFPLAKIRGRDSVREVRCAGNEVHYLIPKSSYTCLECLFSPEKNMEIEGYAASFSLDNSGNPVFAGRAGIYKKEKMLLSSEDAHRLDIRTIFEPICREDKTFAFVEYKNRKTGIIEILKNESPRDLLLYDFNALTTIINAEILDFGNTAALDGTFYPFSFVSCVSGNSIFINYSQISGSEEPSRIANVRAGFIKGNIADIFLETAEKIYALKIDLIKNAVVSKKKVYENKNMAFNLKFDLVMRGELEKRIVAFSSGQE